MAFFAALAAESLRSNRDARRTDLRVSDEARMRVTGIDDRPQGSCSKIRVASNQEASGGLRIGENMALPFGKIRRQADRLGVTCPVALRSAGDETLLYQRPGVRQQGQITSADHQFEV